MSFIYRDASVVPRERTNQAISNYKRFDKFWGRRIVDGIESYEVSSPFFYTKAGFDQSETTKKFVKSLGINWSEFIAQDINEEIEGMFFTLRGGFEWDGTKAYAPFSTPKTPTEAFIVPTPQQIVDNFNSAIQVDERVKVTVSYGGQLKRYIDEHELEWIATGVEVVSGGLNTSAIRSVLHSNPWYYFANSRHEPYVKNSTPFQLYDGNQGEKIPLAGSYLSDRKLPPCDTSSTVDILGTFALLGDNASFEIVLTDGLPRIEESIITKSTGINDGEALEYQYTLEYIFKGVSASSSMVKQIHNWYSFYFENLDDIPITDGTRDRYKEEITTSAIDTKMKRAMIDMMIDPNPDTTDSLYAKDGAAYLRVDAVKEMKKRDFTRLLSTKIKVDYKVEKASFFEVVLAIVMIVVSIVIGFFTAGSTWAYTPMWFTVLAGTTATAMTVGGLVLSQIGGLSAMGLVKVIGSFAQIAGMISLVAGITSNFVGLTNRIATEGFKQTATGLLTETVTSIKKRITGLFETGTSVNAMKDMIKLASTGFEFYSDEERERLQAEYKTLQEDETKYNEEILNDYFTNAPAIFTLSHERLSTPDMLQDLAIEIEDRVGQDENFRIWNSNVNL